ncbi:MAG: T9SS type A sorting domain-containing protein [Bacteroidota bacterium]
MLYKIVLFFTLIISARALAQNAEEFCLTIDVGGNPWQGLGLLQGSDGSFYVAGTKGTLSPDADFYLCKISGSGTLLWSKTMGTSNQDWLEDICEAPSGNIMLAGRSVSSGSYLIKTDSSGTVLSTATYFEDVQHAIIKTSDNGYALTGSPSTSWGPGISVVRIDSSLNLLWSRISAFDGNGTSLFQTSDGGFAIAGIHNDDAALVKLDSLGNSQWTKTIGGNLIDKGYSVIQTNNGDYIISGTTNSVSGGTDYDVYLAKLNSSGNLLWTKSFGTPTEWEEGHSLLKTYDGGYALTINYGNGTRLSVMKFDANDSLQWASGTTNVYGYAPRLIQTNDHGFAVAGHSGGTTVSLVKMDSMGNGCCMIPLTLHSNSTGILGNPGTMISLFNNQTGSIGAIVTAVNFTSTMVCISTGILPQEQKLSEIIMSPNPSTGSFNIDFERIINEGNLRLYNSLGQNFYTEKIINESKKEAHIKNLPMGIYLVKVFDGEKSYCKKLIIEHD